MNHTALLNLPGVSVTPTGLRFAPRVQLSFPEWESACQTITRVREVGHWALGDLLTQGNAWFGEEYLGADFGLNLSPETLKQVQWVSERVAPERRRETLSWSHHRCVAGKEPDEQDEWLDRAEQNDWSSRELAMYMKALEPGKEQDDDGKQVSFTAHGTSKKAVALLEEAVTKRYLHHTVECVGLDEGDLVPGRDAVECACGFVVWSEKLNEVIGEPEAETEE